VEEEEEEEEGEKARGNTRGPTEGWEKCRREKNRTEKKRRGTGEGEWDEWRAAWKGRREGGRCIRSVGRALSIPCFENVDRSAAR